MVRGVMFSALLLVLGLFSSAFAADKEHTHDGHKAPHGGVLLEVGEDAAHVELVHDEKGGKVTLYILDGEVKNPVALKEAPKLNLKTEKGNKQIETKLVDEKAAKYEATDDALKADPLKGRIALTIGDKKYNVDLKEEHDHKH